MKRPMQIQYQKGYKYQLIKIYKCNIGIYGYEISTPFLTLDKAGNLTITVGYAWDGPSGPAIDTPTFMRGSLVHDAIYQLMRMGLLPQHCRLPADLVMKRICKEAGMCKARIWWVFKGVRKFAKSAADPKNKRKIFEAP